MADIERLIATGVLLGAFVSIMAAYSKANRDYSGGKDQSRSNLPAHRKLDLYLRVSTPAFAFGALWLPNVPLLTPLHQGSVALVVGGLVVLASVAVLFWALRTLADSYSPSFDAYDPNRIVVTGPYRWVRHPVYTANIGMLLGAALVTGSVGVVMNAGLLLTSYLVSAIREERVLCDRFPEYRDHYGRTGRFLPTLWIRRHPAS